MRKYPAVPVADAVTDHVPESVFEPAEAAFIQLEGQAISASNVPVAAAAQFAGTEPV